MLYNVRVQCHSCEPHVTPEHLKCGWCTWGSGFLFVFNVAAVLVSTVLGPRWVSLEIRCVCVFIFPEKAVFDSLILSLPSLSLVRETLSLKQLPLKSFPLNVLLDFMKTAWGGTYLVVQGLELCASSAGNSGLIPVREWDPACQVAQPKQSKSLMRRMKVRLDLHLGFRCLG